MQICLEADEKIDSPTTWTLENAIFSLKMEWWFEFSTGNVFVAHECKYTKFPQKMTGTHTYTHLTDSIWCSI